MMKLFFISIASMSFYLQACNNNDHTGTAKQINEKQLNDTLVKANQTFVDTEKDRINGYIERRNLKMQETGSGLRYAILRSTEGEKAKPGQRATVNFKVSLLNGTVCYSSEEKGAQEFLIAEDNVESGLHEGVQLMRVGEKAKFILPAHLAHGLIGDENKIPPRSVIVYDVELLKLK